MAPNGILLAGLILPLLLLDSLKIIEMWACSVVPNLRFGSSRADAFHKALAEYGPTEASRQFRESGYNPWKITEQISSFIPVRYGRLCRWLMSWPLLTILTTLALVLVSEGIFGWLLGVVLLFLLLTRVAHRVCARLFLGVADNVFLDPFGRKRVPFNLSRLAGSALVRLMIDVAAIALAFSAVYYVGEKAFPSWLNPAEKSSTWLSCVYFSFVTVSTTGYGDMFPSSEWAKFLVLAELVLTWSVIVVMGLHYGITLVELEDVARTHDDKAAPESLEFQEASLPSEESRVPNDRSLGAARNHSAEPPVGWWEPMFGLIQALLALLLLASVLQFLFVQWGATTTGTQSLFSEQVRHHLEELLSFFFLLIVVLELAETLISQKPDNIVDVLVFVVARKMVLKSEAAWEVLIGVVAIAVLFIVRRQIRGEGVWDRIIGLVRQGQ